MWEGVVCSLTKLSGLASLGHNCGVLPAATYIVLSCVSQLLELTVVAEDLPFD